MIRASIVSDSFEEYEVLSRCIMPTYSIGSEMSGHQPRV